jgi:hypothetical protein
MSAVLMKQAIIERAQYALGQAPASPTLKLDLYVNNYAPVATDVIGDYTLCTLAGYATVNLVAGNWVLTWNAANNTETAQYPTQTWNFTNGGQTLYGYVLQDTLSGKIWYAEQFATPYVVPAGGGQFVLTLNWTDEGCVAT